LLNQLANSDVYVADELFATLDPTTRRVELPGGHEALFTDTVGFIQKLPTTLVAAFRATLEEIAEAELLLHVVDITHPNAQEQASGLPYLEIGGDILS
jgi:GTP-binding protein HflX